VDRLGPQANLIRHIRLPIPASPFIWSSMPGHGIVTALQTLEASCVNLQVLVLMFQDDSEIILTAAPWVDLLDQKLKATASLQKVIIEIHPRAHAHVAEQFKVLRTAKPKTTRAALHAATQRASGIEEGNVGEDVSYDGAGSSTEENDRDYEDGLSDELVRKVPERGWTVKARWSWICPEHRLKFYRARDCEDHVLRRNLRQMGE